MKNIADVIEHYIVTMLLNEADHEVQMNRNDVATKMGCAPSQISYVISTRFTPARGYIVQSKRGSGGFIRIVQLEPREKQPQEPTPDEYLDYWYQTKALTSREYVMLKYLFGMMELNDKDKLALLRKTLKQMIQVS